MGRGGEDLPAASIFDRSNLTYAPMYGSNTELMMPAPGVANRGSEPASSSVRSAPAIAAAVELKCQRRAGICGGWEVEGNASGSKVEEGAQVGSGAKNCSLPR